MSDRKGPFISQRAIHSFLPERQIGGIRPVGTGRLFAIASGRTLKVIHQNHFPFPKLSPAQLSWCCLDELAVSSCVSLCRQGYSYYPLGCKYKSATSRHNTFTVRLLNQFFRSMYWGHYMWWCCHTYVATWKKRLLRLSWPEYSAVRLIERGIHVWIVTTHQLFTVFKHLFWSCPMQHGNIILL